MAEVKRWSVTYTKHMKQKRKVYQDGFLELHTSTNKMLLFDDCEKLLECRILKKDEAVNSGETLTFNAFLVDVNDAESGDGDQKPKSGFSSRENDMKFSEKRAKSWNKPQPFQTPAQNIIRGKKPLQNLSPSQNIIKEFKKRELHKYGAALSSPETVTTSTTEWQALYTTQLTQKAKKYHDGFLQLAITGSHGKQIILLDSSRNQLDSRFLKKDEVIASGGSIAFDAHLVDIGEQEGDHKPATDLHRKENKRNIVGEARIKQEQSNGVMTGKDDGKEWKVLYTTQVTQKAKKYHDGFLQIASSGSFGRQVMLFDATRKLLETRFLKKDEVISSGESFAFNAHLVDVGEPDGNEAQVDLKSQGKDCHVQKSGKLHREDDCIIIDEFELKEWEALYTTQITQKSKKYHVGILRLASSGSFRKKVTLLGEDKTILSNKYVSLSEDIKTGSTLELPKYLVEVGIPRAIAGGEETTLNKACMKKPSDSRFSISSVEETKLSRGVSRNNPLCDGEENSQKKACSKKALNSSFSISSVEETKPSGVPTSKLLRDAHQILSFLQNPMAQVSVASRQANSTEKPVSSTKGSQVSDAIMVDIAEDVRPAESQSSEPHNRSVENKEPGNITEIGIKAMSSGCGSQLAEGIDIKISHQLHSDHVEADTARHNRECASDESRSSSCFSHDAADDKKIVSQEPSCARNQECPSFELEFPSFDLGF